MTKEMDEMREVLGEAFCRILSEEVRFRDSAGVWRPMIGLVKEMVSNLLDEVSSAKTDTCRIRTIPKTKIVCLCGSTRFTEEMLVKQWELTKQGFVVLSWCALPEWYFTGDDKTHIGDQEGVKEIVDTIHMRKIDLADRVMVLNIGGYVGESTRREIEYAELQGKPIDYLEPVSNAGFVPEVKDDQRV